MLRDKKIYVIPNLYFDERTTPDVLSVSTDLPSDDVLITDNW